ncbi:universal stress protein [Bacillus taeanensis]|uniref:Universal stress protein n=1 Tax=Bacillus taeanensis TaxID=273032 RepID=A0A366XXD8_9BACI|nr:universal stress protein [Bacillus taeanensis]RBW68803.1 universal stress protein UspA [Bacillus taeanensis]
MANDYNHILAAVDGSDSAKKAFQKALKIAKQHEASLTIVHVIDTTDYSAFELYNIATERAEDRANKIMEEYRKEAQEEDIVKVETIIEYGSPKRKIAKEIAPKHEIDLIVCGATGIHGLDRLFIGSVSEHITRYAKCDVLVVKG